MEKQSWRNEHRVIVIHKRETGRDEEGVQEVRKNSHDWQNTVEIATETDKMNDEIKKARADAAQKG